MFIWWKKIPLWFGDDPPPQPPNPEPTIPDHADTQ